MNDNTTTDRAAKAEALLLYFTAEAHRRKWNYDRGLDDDGVPIKSEAFDALHRLGEEMRVELERLRRLGGEAAPDNTETGSEADPQTGRPTAEFSWSHLIPAPTDAAAQERDRLVDCINRVRLTLQNCKARGATGMQYENAVLEALGDRKPRRGPGPLCHESDPHTLRECALKAKHDGDHRDGDLVWPREQSAPDNTETQQDGARP
jgi:hypothetical protein